MGYKLAGYDVIGNVEIDPRVMEIYKKNNHPKYPYLMDVRDFLKIPDNELPDELFNLDILDGSPPCSVFSSAGKREEGWNREKVFREGQSEQRLDDLFFWFIRIAEKLKPKVVIAENVPGLIKGNARGYVNEIIKAFKTVGYKVQMFLLNAASMGVPSSRERVFFIFRKNGIGDDIKLSFNETPILFGDVRSEEGEPCQGLIIDLVKKRKPGDRCVADIYKREFGRNSSFTQMIVSDSRVCGTIISGGNYYRMKDGMKFSSHDFVSVQTFPQDYDFGNESVQYVCGMSVPPVMMAQISSEVYKQWFSGGGE